MDNIKVELVKYPTENDWLLCKNEALNTIWKNSEKEVTSKWKSMILRSEHSPIRSLWYTFKIYNIPYWVSTHFVRHKIGVEHFISSQRPDRQNEYDRNLAPQNSPVTHMMTANAQAIINISKVRLCYNASRETRYVWNLVLDEIEKVTPELYNLCVPSCIYRNSICPEPTPCGYTNGTQFKEKLDKYTSKI